MTKPPLIVVAGPTAAGKSSLGVALARALDGEVVSADSVQLYRGFDIGSATPTIEEQGGIPHRMLNVLEPDVVYSASAYASAARDAIADIHRRGKLPIVVGGSGLYLRALLFGLSDSPGRDPELRRRLRCEAEERGLDALYGRLRTVDPEYAAKIHANDRVRIVRALEVYERTGETLTQQHRAQDDNAPFYRIAGVGLSAARKVLHQRIERRVQQMFAAGLVDEVRTLLDAGVSPSAQPMQSIGYREVLGIVEGQWDQVEAMRLVARNTRRFAKRQLVWFRKDEWLRWLSLTRLDTDYDDLLASLERFLAGHPHQYGACDERPISGT